MSWPATGRAGARWRAGAPAARRPAWRGLAALPVVLAAGPAAAHGFGQRYDLPVPLALWVAGGAAAVALSFVVVGVAVRGRTSESPRVDLLRWRLGRALVSAPVRRAVEGVAVGLLALVLAAGIAGDQNPTRNLAPVWVWVVWWVGLAYVSALVGNLWTVANPWAALFRWAERLAARHGRVLGRGLPYPAGLGQWPAVLLFGGFAWIELVYSGRTLPARLAGLTLAYTAITWTGMWLVGRAVWLRHADPFAVAFGILARFAPTEARVTDPSVCRDCVLPCGKAGDGCVDCSECFDRAAPEHRRWTLRPWGAGLLRTEDVTPSTVAFVLLLLATVTFDGVTATPAWAALEAWLYAALAPLGDLRLTVIGTAGLAAFPALFALGYGLFACWMARAGGELPPATVARLFVLSLVPIAIAYHLAHYFTYLLIQGQLLIRLASDPFGYGWNLFGTGRYRPDVGIVGARFAWYTAVIAIVVGHIVAVWVAHRLALREYADRRAAVRSQVPMLVLMVGYTMLSLWIVAQPIVERGAR